MHKGSINCKKEENQKEENLSLEERIRISTELLEKNNSLFEFGEMISKINQKPCKIDYQKLADVYLGYLSIKNEYKLEANKLKNQNNIVKTALREFKIQLNKYYEKIITAITTIYNNRSNEYEKFKMYHQLVKIYFGEDEENVLPILLKYTFEMQNLLAELEKSSKKNTIKKYELNKIRDFIEMINKVL